ncbi:hypothetical protein PTKIN_Ptkin11bG0126600 [Pterospermum kingtungense]
MDHENSIVKPNTLFQVVPAFMKKILPRKSFSSQSRPMDHTETVVSVPFDWEIKPGVPKHLYTTDHIVPPITPPSAVLQSKTLKKLRLSSITHATKSWSWRSHFQGKKKTTKGEGRG